MCIGSGPSLRAGDVAAVERWRNGSNGGAGQAEAGAASQGRRVIVTNAGYQLAPWADALFAMDAEFWKAYGADIDAAGFRGERWTTARVAGVGKLDAAGIQNSGAGAIVAAARWGARRVVLLGYDGQKTDGRAHWHADHPPGLGNAGAVALWPDQFRTLARYLAGYRLDIVNASRVSAVDAFPRVPLEDALPWPM